MALSLFFSKFLNNTCHFPNFQKICEQQKNICHYVRRIEELQVLYTELCTAIRREDCLEHLQTLLKRHMKSLNHLYSSNFSTYTHYSDGLGSKLEESGLLSFICVSLKTNVTV